MISEVTHGSLAKADYSWLANGRKAEVADDAGNGFLYLGSLIYTKTGNGHTFESTGFGAGRIQKASSGYNVNYHITDHLGSVRVVFRYGTNNSIVRVAQNDFYAFGKKHQNSLLAAGSDTENRFLFNGKENQTIGGLGLLDYGARMYDDELGIWKSIDPMTEKRIWLSTYNFVQNRPINRVDPDGMLDDNFYFDENYNLIKYVNNDSEDRVFVANGNTTEMQLISVPEISVDVSLSLPQFDEVTMSSEQIENVMKDNNYSKVTESETVTVKETTYFYSEAQGAPKTVSSTKETINYLQTTTMYVPNNTSLKGVSSQRLQPTLERTQKGFYQEETYVEKEVIIILRMVHPTSKKTNRILFP